MSDWSDLIVWPDPWEGFSAEDIDQRAPNILDELHREICESHPLFGLTLQPIANNNDDYLFATELPDQPFVMVHMTWARETDPHWPFITWYESLGEFIADVASSDDAVDT